MTNLEINKIKDSLHQALGNIEPFEECVLLDYPDYNNIGDHLIWLGTVLYLTEVLKVTIKYVASIKNFSPIEMERQAGKIPILLQGGGNFGDVWSEYQEFRERIITKYRDRPIIILPQSIYFSSPDNLDTSAKIFNAHPNLTLFVRDNYSYAIAQKSYPHCRVFKAPDMAFQMVGLSGLLKNTPQGSILYHCRQDKELNTDLSQSINLKDLVVQDWVSYQWIYRENLKNSNYWYAQIPGIAKLIREGWQRRLSSPKEWVSRQKWQQIEPKNNLLNNQYKPLYRRSWNLMHSGMYQFHQHRFIITNRLHGHILCLLLQIPHLFLPNSYYKNEQFYKTWTEPVSFCKFLSSSEIEDIEQLIIPN